MASADIEVNNALNGVQEDGTGRPWAYVHVRARTVYGNLKQKPFTWSINNATVATTPSALDHLIGTAEQVAWRYVASDKAVYDLKDFMLLQLEYFLENIDPAKLAALKATASTLRPWPVGYPGTPDCELGQ